jgi:hypothetical protein
MSRDQQILGKALDKFQGYLKGRRFELSTGARLELQNYIMAKKEKVFLPITRKERPEEDLADSFRKLADVAIEIAASAGRKTVNEDDVKKALAKVFCGFWPFCS